MQNHIVNLSVSCFITAKFEAHGMYNKLNIKNEIALALLKQTTLEDITNEEISSLVLKTLLQILIVEIINSLAMTPTKSEQTTPALSNPIGANKNVSLSPIKNNTLS